MRKDWLSYLEYIQVAKEGSVISFPIDFFLPVCYHDDHGRPSTASVLVVFGSPWFLRPGSHSFAMA